MPMKPLTQCPMCDSRRVRRVCETVEFKRQSETLSIPSVSFDRCDNCGERFYGPEANEKIDAVMIANRRRKTRRKSA